MNMLKNLLYYGMIAEADKRGAEAIEVAEQNLKATYNIYQNTPVSDDALQQLIKVKNSARNLQNKMDRTVRASKSAKWLSIN